MPSVTKPVESTVATVEAHEVGTIPVCLHRAELDRNGCKRRRGRCRLSRSPEDALKLLTAALNDEDAKVRAAAAQVPRVSEAGQWPS